MPYSPYRDPPIAGRSHLLVFQLNLSQNVMHGISFCKPQNLPEMLISSPAISIIIIIIIIIDGCLVSPRMKQVGNKLEKLVLPGKLVMGTVKSSAAAASSPFKLILEQVPPDGVHP